MVASFVSQVCPSLFLNGLICPDMCWYVKSCRLVDYFNKGCQFWHPLIVQLIEYHLFMYQPLKTGNGNG